MNKTEVLKRIRETGLIPVVRADSSDQALQAVAALMAGGLDVLEVTMTVPGAIEVIRVLSNEYGADALIGAGTVLDPEKAQACIQAGAQFIVSPALNEETIAFCAEQDVVIFPGALTPTEVVTAWQAGADAVKIFPCGAVGGAKYLASLKAPLPQIEMIPTGGVSLTTAASFIAAGALALGVGADLVDLAAIRSGEPERVTQSARAYIAAVRDARQSLSPAEFLVTGSGRGPVQG